MKKENIGKSSPAKVWGNPDLEIIWPGFLASLFFVPGILREAAGGERDQLEFQQLFRKIHL